ncbi:hypothetical protein [uncultured Tateyamaria sp.]|uniref:hypothetical protein n=1 Tax=uncultured Tateyamaria sp. TaxID=455651 RepID=UPI002634CA7A|nr:hypothetical protein [uncultured Tateyamaria sp.]
MIVNRKLMKSIPPPATLQNLSSRSTWMLTNAYHLNLSRKWVRDHEKTLHIDQVAEAPGVFASNTAAPAWVMAR